MDFNLHEIPVNYLEIKCIKILSPFISDMRTKLCDKYKTEREAICERLIEILELDTNNSFYLYELDNNIEKQIAIMDMKNEIQKYFACSEISSFRSNIECKRPYLSIVRGILRKQGYIFFSNNIDLKTEDGINRTIKYNIFRKN